MRCLGNSFLASGSEWLGDLLSIDRAQRRLAGWDGGVLRVFDGDETVEIINKPNSGHGPTILQGYRRGVEIADWVFQCDSDDEMKAEHFPSLWEKREENDALFGSRVGRIQSLDRKILSFGSRLVVRTLFGKGIVDVNTAYRLMRSHLLKRVVAQMPDRIFAPNVIISGALARAGARVVNLPVPFEPRRTGTVSVPQGWKVLKTAWQCLWQTVRCRPVVRLDGKPSASAPKDVAASG